jgi:hypothetical protein
MVANITKDREFLKKESKARQHTRRLNRVEGEEFRFRRSLLRFRKYLLSQMRKRFDRVLSGKLDAVDFLLGCYKRKGKK